MTNKHKIIIDLLELPYSNYADEDRERAREKHIKILMSGVKSWNKWREDNPEIRPELYMTKIKGTFCGANLKSVNFEGAIFDHCILAQSKMKGANLAKSFFDECNIQQGNLSEAILSSSHFQNCNLAWCDFTKSKLDRSKFVNCYAIRSKFDYASANNAELIGINLSSATAKNFVLAKARIEDVVIYRVSSNGIDLSSSTITTTDFNICSMDGANFSNAILKSVSLHESNLTNANLVDCKGIIFSSNIIRNAILTPHSSDPWSVLRYTYTGPRLIFNLLFFLVFLSPYIAKSVFWLGVTRYQSYILDNWTISSNADSLGVYSNSLCLSDKCDHLQVWEVILGLDKPPLFWITALILIYYNFQKFILTMIVSPLRDEEERSGVVPSYYSGINTTSLLSVKQLPILVSRFMRSYYWMYRIHQFISPLFWLGIIIFLLHTLDWLSMYVYVPEQ